MISSEQICSFEDLCDSISRHGGTFHRYRRSFISRWMSWLCILCARVDHQFRDDCRGRDSFRGIWTSASLSLLPFSSVFTLHPFSRPPRLQQFWKSPYNVVDLGLTCLCVLTLLVILFAGCGATSKEEELLDTLLLVARNVLQFGRLATVMRRCALLLPFSTSVLRLTIWHNLPSSNSIRSGRSIFARPKAIDLSAARSTRLDIDLDDEEAAIGFGIGNDHDRDVEFDAEAEFETPRVPPYRTKPLDQTDVWARVG